MDHEETRHDGVLELQHLLKEKLDNAVDNQTDFLPIVREHSPIDLAYAASHIPSPARSWLYEHLDTIESKIQFLIYTTSQTRVAIFRRIECEEIALLVGKMAPEDAVHVLEDVSQRCFRRVMERLDPEFAEKILKIRQTPCHSAGRMMTQEFFAFSLDTSIGEVGKLIKEHPGIELGARIFVIHEGGKLQGFVPARHLITYSPQLLLREVMRPLGQKAYADTPREEVVEMVERHKLSLLPVVDIEERLIGVITQEDVLDSMHDILDETVSSVGGTAEKITEDAPYYKRFFSRAPWLIVTLCVGLVNGSVMSLFAGSITEFFAFVLFFVPLINGMSGNIGLQCSTVLVRGMAVGVISVGQRRKAMAKEIKMGLCTGLCFGVLFAALLYFLNIEAVGFISSAIHPLARSLLLGAGLCGACFVGTLIGVLSPFFFVRFGIDPAVASGPIVTALNDFLSMSVYFLIVLGIKLLFFF